MTESTTTSLTPPLTTIYTPPPSCSSVHVYECGLNACSASIGDFSEDGWNPSCFPNVEVKVSGNSSSIYPQWTYSPGFSCPLGMVTAGNLGLPHDSDAAYCCYSYFTIRRQAVPFHPKCEATLTEGTLIAPNPNSGTSLILPFGPQQTSLFQSMAFQLGADILKKGPTVVVFASPIVLLHQNRAAQVSSTTLATSQSSEISLAPPTTTSDVTTDSQNPLNNSKGSEIAAGVGGALGTALFLGLGAFLVKRYRGKRLHRLSQDNMLDEEKQYNGYDNKPELEGSEARRKRLTKAELDALVIRAELEGSPGEEYGAGINVLKPELQGSQAVHGLVGIGVEKKAELEGSAGSGTGGILMEAEESTSANRQPSRNDAGPVAELEANDVPYTRDIGNGRPASNRLSQVDTAGRTGACALLSSDSIPSPPATTELAGSE